MKFLKFPLAVFVFLMFVNQSIAQQKYSPEQAEVNQIIINLFDGMRVGDSAKVASTFSRDVRMFSVYRKKTGEQVLHEGKLSGFLNAVGTPHDQIWNEKVWDVEIQVDATLAQVWAPYAFYLGDKFSHCGVNAFQLVKSDGHWKIVHLMDTRRVAGCEQAEEK